jgi:transposase
MSSRFVNIDRETPMLLPPDLRDWVQEDDLAHFLVDALSLLDFSGATVNVRGTGSEQYPPGMMLSLLIYCYAHGIFSSRQIERATDQHLSVRYLAANTHPDHDTIAKFRRDNGPLVRSAFVQLLQLARAAGLLQLGAVALDGTKLQANAAKHKTRTAQRLQEELAALEVQVNELLQRAQQADQTDAAARQLPRELAQAQARRTRLLQAKAQLEQQAKARQEQREVQRQQRPPGDRRPPPGSPEPCSRDTINPTDPDSTLTRARFTCIQGYNAQVAISAQATGLIVATDVVRDANDLQQLQPMSQQIHHNVGSVTHLLVDTGYENTRQIRAVEQQHGVRVFFARQPFTIPKTPATPKAGGARRAKLSGSNCGNASRHLGAKNCIGCAAALSNRPLASSSTPWALCALACADSPRSNWNGNWFVSPSTAGASHASSFESSNRLAEHPAQASQH